MATTKVDWQYLPISTFGEDYVIFKNFVISLKLPKECLEPVMSQNHHVYFTDGACIHPTIPEARLASWAVVRDYADSYEHALAMTSIALQNKNPCPLLRPLDMGLVEGRQTISRGELCAVIMACENALQDRTMLKSDIFSDSQYVVNVIHFLEIGDLVRWGYKIANFDLVQRLQKFRIHKVKSHLDWMSQETLSSCRKSMGNYVADRIATLALKRCPSWMIGLANAMAQCFDAEKKSLHRVFSYLVDQQGAQPI